MNRWGPKPFSSVKDVGVEDDDADHGYPGWPTSGLQMSLALHLRPFARFNDQSAIALTDHSGGREAVLLILWLRPAIVLGDLTAVLGQRGRSRVRQA